MKKSLQLFQAGGALFLASKYHAALGDERGLGKTLQAIRATEIVQAKKVLVVCPASVRTNWTNLLDECLGVDGHNGWEIISYNQARSMSLALPTGDGPIWNVIILDEAHFCKTVDSQRTQAIFGKRGLARRAEYKWCLSGTLTPNGRPAELYPMLKTLAPAFAKMSYSVYTQRYCGAYFDGFGWNVKGATRVDELSRLLGDFMLRRTQAEVYPDRLEPLVSRVPIELSAEDMRAVRAEEDAIGGRAARISQRYEDFSQLGDSSRLLRLLGEAKVPKVCEFVDDLLQSVDKVCVFAHHKEVIKRLYERFITSGYHPVVYTGGMTDAQKDNQKQQFMEDPQRRVFVGQRQAAGTGINGLQRVCSTMVIAEAPWDPGATDQLIGRLDRIGQKDPLVNAYVLYARGTLDYVVVSVHDRKEKVDDRLMGDSDRATRRILGEWA